VSVIGAFVACGGLSWATVEIGKQKSRNMAAALSKEPSSLRLSSIRKRECLNRKMKTRKIVERSRPRLRVKMAKTQKYKMCSAQRKLEVMN
jgi:hypothetical protein